MSEFPAGPVRPEGYPEERWAGLNGTTRQWVVDNWAWYAEMVARETALGVGITSSPITGESPSQESAYVLVDPDAAPEVVLPAVPDVPAVGEGVTEVWRDPDLAERLAEAGEVPDLSWLEPAPLPTADEVVPVEVQVELVEDPVGGDYFAATLQAVDGSTATVPGTAMGEGGEDPLGFEAVEEPVATYDPSPEMVTPLPAEQVLQSWAAQVEAEAVAPVRRAGAWTWDAAAMLHRRSDGVLVLAEVMPSRLTWWAVMSPTPSGDVLGGAGESVADCKAQADAALRGDGWLLDGDTGPTVSPALVREAGARQEGVTWGSAVAEMDEPPFETPFETPMPAMVIVPQPGQRVEFEPVPTTLPPETIEAAAFEDEFGANAGAGTQDAPPAPERDEPTEWSEPVAVGAATPAPSEGAASPSLVLYHHPRFLHVTDPTGRRVALQKTDVVGWVSGSRDKRSELGVGCMLFIRGDALVVWRGYDADWDPEVVDGVGVVQTYDEIEAAMGSVVASEVA